jgi:thymidine phosphorylase
MSENFSNAPKLGNALIALGTISQLKLRRVAIDTYHENVVYLNRECAFYRAEGFQALSKVEVRANGHKIVATLNVVDDPAIVGCSEVGLSEDAFSQMGIKDGHTATVSQAESVESIGALFRKINGERLTQEDFLSIVRDISQHRYSKIELTAFVIATNRGEMDRDEVYFLAEAMVACGRRCCDLKLGLARHIGRNFGAARQSARAAVDLQNRACFERDCCWHGDGGARRCR